MKKQVLKVDELTPGQAFFGDRTTGYIAETDRRKVESAEEGKVSVFLTPLGAETSIGGARREVEAQQLRIISA